MLELIIITIVLALLFDFVNGFHDSANAISTVVATKVLTPLQAVAMAAVGNLIGPLFFTTAIAATMGKGIIDTDAIRAILSVPQFVALILAALIGAIIWDLITWILGLPTSSSHALIGGLVGAASVSVGTKYIIASGVEKVLLFIVLSPLLGFFAAFLMAAIVMHIMRKSTPVAVNGHFKRLQLFSAFFYSVTHGTNDAQKTMGIISILLFSAGYLGPEFYVPMWVVVLSAVTICAGTLLGGKRVVETMGLRLISIRPVDGFAAETAGAGTIIASSMLGVPVSTTHVICGSIVGVGMAKRANKIRWPIARHIFWAWVFTIPVAAISGAIILTTIKAAGF